MIIPRVARDNRKSSLELSIVLLKLTFGGWVSTLCDSRVETTN
jgi:hypothetical protein